MAFATDDIFSFSAFDPSKVTGGFRDFAEKGASQSLEAYAKIKTVTEDAARTMGTTVQSAQSGTVGLGLKAIDALRANADMSLSHMQALMGVRSMSEFFELQTSFLRRQAEATVEQSRTLQDAARQLADDVAKPGREAAEKVMAGFRAG